MFTVAAVLPFLPLIEDAMIRQLGDDTYWKREAATRFLSRMLRDTDGIRSYWILLKVKKAAGDRREEVSRRADTLYRTYRPNYILDYPHGFAVFRIDHNGQEKDFAEECSKILKQFTYLRISRDGSGGPTKDRRYYCMYIEPEILKERQLKLIRKHPHFKQFVPLGHSRDFRNDVKSIRIDEFHE
jgi:hypothetical protein